MSRIEKALEKAVKLRETTANIAPGADAQAAEPARPRPTFAVGEPAVDQSLVDRHIVFASNPKSPAAEQYRKLRARVLRISRKDNLNTLMIASSDSGEGKTVTAINLAIAIAQEIDHTVLLVDGDLRNPSMHRYLGIGPKPGLSDYLMHKASLSDLLLKTGIGKLVLLPAGTPVENPAELIASSRMRDLVKEMKNRYHDRYVIFDSAPVLLAADALSLANYMDGLVFVVQADHTSPKAVTSALSLLKGFTILGSVFNNVPAYLNNGRHSYYYRYGGRYTIGSSPAGGNGGHGPDPTIKQFKAESA